MILTAGNAKMMKIFIFSWKKKKKKISCKQYICPQKHYTYSISL